MKIQIRENNLGIGYTLYLIFPDLVFVFIGQRCKILLHRGKPAFGAYRSLIDKRVYFPETGRRFIKAMKFIGKIPRYESAAAGKQIFPAKGTFTDRTAYFLFGKIRYL
jgi:hypothetical protein